MINLTIALCFAVFWLFISLSLAFSLYFIYFLSLSLFIPLYLCLLFISLSVPVLFSLSNNHAHTLSRSLSLFLSLSFGYFFYPCLLDDFSLSLIPMLFLTIDKLFWFVDQRDLSISRYMYISSYLHLCLCVYCLVCWNISISHSLIPMLFQSLDKLFWSVGRENCNLEQSLK